MKTNMNKEKSDTKINRNNSTNALSKDNENVKLQMVYTPKRFSVRGLRKHRGIQTSRTPQVSF